MSKAARSRGTPRRTASPEEAAYLDLLRTTDVLSRPLAELLKTEELSPAQYNVLRILRGSPEGLTCGEIANRMITRDPDITRLLDRLERRTLVLRRRDGKDRRIVLTRIAPAGLDVLERLDAPVRKAHRRLLGHLGAARRRALAGLLEACRAGTR
jgi:DNA-binding MarR family transcriptional regulator